MSENIQKPENDKIEKSSEIDLGELFKFLYSIFYLAY